VLLGVTAINEIGAWFLPAIPHIKNVAWYNIFMGVEFLMYACYYLQIIRNKAVRLIIKVYIGLFAVFWFIAVFWVFGIKTWNSYVAICGGIGTTLLSVYYYYQLFTEKELVKLSKSSEFWIATGLIIFYSCNLPYTGMLNFLVKNYLPLAQKLLFVLQVLNILMYFMFIYAFLCRISTTKSGLH
jgi:hypothetical protein